MAEIGEGRKFEKIALDYMKQNNLSEAESNFIKALTHMKQSGDEEGQAYVLGNLGNLCFQSRRLDKAEDYYGKALTYMEKVNDPRGIESSLGNLGSVFFYKGNLDKAEATYKKALKFLEEANDTEGQSIYNENLGNVYLKKEELAKAEDYFNRAKTLLDSEKNKDQIKQVVDKLDALQKHPKHVEGKEGKLLKEIDSLIKGGEKRGALSKYQELEEIYYQGGNIGKAADTISKSIELFEELGDKNSAGICMGNLAGLLLQLGYSGQPEQFDKAEEYCKRALDIIGAGKDKRRQSYLLGSLGNINLHKKDLDKAWENYNQSLGFMAELGDVLGEARGYSNLGNVRLLQENYDDARVQFENSLELMEQLEDRPGIAQQCESLGDIYLKQGNLQMLRYFLVELSLFTKPCRTRKDCNRLRISWFISWENQNI